MKLGMIVVPVSRFTKLARWLAAAGLLASYLSWGSRSFADEQKGGEGRKRPVSAEITSAGGGQMFGDERIGNVEVTYADGTKDRWTTKGNCGLPRVAADGTVGWTVFEPERKPPELAYTVRNNFSLVLCRRGKVLTVVYGSLGFIEDWNFLAGGKEVVLKTRALHGPALIERHESATGKLRESFKAYGDDLPAWADRFAD